MAVVYLGNHNTIDRRHVLNPDGSYAADNGQWVFEVTPVPGKNRMTYAPPADWTTAEILTDLMRVWPTAHSLDPKPAWVASDDPALAAAIGAVWDVPVRDVDLNHQPDPTPEG